MRPRASPEAALAGQAPSVWVTDEIVLPRLLDLLTPAGSPGLGPEHISFTGDLVL